MDVRGKTNPYVFLIDRNAFDIKQGVKPEYPRCFWFLSESIMRLKTQIYQRFAASQKETFILKRTLKDYVKITLCANLFI